MPKVLELNDFELMHMCSTTVLVSEAINFHFTILFSTYSAQGSKRCRMLVDHKMISHIWLAPH